MKVWAVQKGCMYEGVYLISIHSNINSALNKVDHIIESDKERYNIALNRLLDDDIPIDLEDYTWIKEGNYNWTCGIEVLLIEQIEVLD